MEARERRIDGITVRTRTRRVVRHVYSNIPAMFDYLSGWLRHRSPGQSVLENGEDPLGIARAFSSKRRRIRRRLPSFPDRLSLLLFSSLFRLSHLHGEYKHFINENRLRKYSRYLIPTSRTNRMLQNFNESDSP